MSDYLQRAIATIKSGDKENGKRLLIKVLETDQHNEDAWLWMTKVVDSNSKRIKCLENVLRINPDNETAKRGMTLLQQKQAMVSERIETSKDESQLKSRESLSTSFSSSKGETTHSVTQDQRPIVIQSPPQSQWNPGIAAVLSLVIPGAGQMYKGQVGKGLFYLFIVIIGYTLFVIPGLILHIFCIINAKNENPYGDTKGRRERNKKNKKLRFWLLAILGLFMLLGLIGRVVTESSVSSESSVSTEPTEQTQETLTVLDPTSNLPEPERGWLCDFDSKGEIRLWTAASMDAIVKDVVGTCINCCVDVTMYEEKSVEGILFYRISVGSQSGWVDVDYYYPADLGKPDWVSN